MRPPGPRADKPPLVGDLAESGFVWSMNWESWLLAKKSFTAVATGFGFTRSWGMSVSISGKVSLSLMARSILTRPILNWFSRSSPTVLTLLLPK